MQIYIPLPVFVLSWQWTQHHLHFCLLWIEMMSLVESMALYAKWNLGRIIVCSRNFSEKKNQKSHKSKGCFNHYPSYPGVLICNLKKKVNSHCMQNKVHRSASSQFSIIFSSSERTNGGDKLNSPSTDYWNSSMSWWWVMSGGYLFIYFLSY